MSLKGLLSDSMVAEGTEEGTERDEGDCGTGKKRDCVAGGSGGGEGGVV